MLTAVGRVAHRFLDLILPPWAQTYTGEDMNIISPRETCIEHGWRGDV